LTACALLRRNFAGLLRIWRKRLTLEDTPFQPVISPESLCFMDVLTPRSAKKSNIGELLFREGLDGLTPARIMTLYRRAPLLRPVNDPDRVWQMFEKATLVVTTWHDGQLVGIARVLSDGVLFSYLCDLAIEPDVQRLGVGKALINKVIELCAGTELVLRDSDLSSGFYAHVGFKRAANAWVRNCR